MLRMRPWMFALAAALALPAGAQTLYKLIDKNGKVTYSESPPKEFDGKVIPLDIDPTRNSATLPKYEPGTAPRSGPFPPGSAQANAINNARDRVEQLRKQLQDARDNPREEDYDHVGNVGGGARPVLNDTYRKRIAKLEEELAKAEAQQRRAEGAR